MSIEVNVVGVLNRSDREGKGPSADFNLGLAAFALGQHIGNELAQEARHFCSGLKIQFSAEDLAGGVGVENDSVMGHAKDGVGIFRGELAQHANMMLDTLARGDHPT